MRRRLFFRIALRDIVPDVFGKRAVFFKRLAIFGLSTLYLLKHSDLVTIVIKYVLVLVITMRYLSLVIKLLCTYTVN